VSSFAAGAWTTALMAVGGADQDAERP